jgi:hypothetical protein
VPFRLITCLPDGTVLHDGTVNQTQSPLEKALQPVIVADGTSRAELQTRVGKLVIEWNADPALEIGTATIWHDEKLAMTMIYLAGVLPKAIELAQVFTKGWDDSEIVKELTNARPVFTTLLDTPDRPFGLALNWATLSAEELNQVGNPDMAVGSAFFQNLASATPRTKSPGVLKRLFGRN